MLTGTVASIGRQSESRFADALETSVFVYTHAVETHVGGGTFIVICQDQKTKSTRDEFDLIISHGGMGLSLGRMAYQCSFCHQG